MELVGRAIDGVGVGVIVVGVMIATVTFVIRLRDRDGLDAYRTYRQGVGRSILLGLEFLVAGDIIRTVAVEPTFRSTGVLVVIVLIRTFLSMALELELEGRWPWQRRAQP